MERKADQQLYDYLKDGEFCYVLNCRQMGKSSLLVKTRVKLEKEGFICTTLDLTNIGSENITPIQWYKGIITDLWRGLKLVNKFDLKAWWQEKQDISLLQRLSQFIEDVVLEEIRTENIIIFLDEIDSVLSLSFPVDDFFAWIRYCYNRRANQSKYNRISFVLFGVATPSDLIQDKNRTPFNIGKAIALEGFKIDEINALATGINATFCQGGKILEAILQWTNGQPFLTQKLCDLVYLSLQTLTKDQASIIVGNEYFWLQNIVEEKIINKWQSQDEPEHLKTIRDRLENHSKRTARILVIYQQLLQDLDIACDDSREQTELFLSGLVINKEGFLKIKNKIYEKVFNLEWVGKQLEHLRPYSQLLDAWVASGEKDRSRLLRGQALQDAQIWAQDKSLSDLDYQFLAASVELEKKETETLLQAALTQEIKAKLIQEKKTARLQRLFLVVMSLGFIVTSILGAIALSQYRKASLSEITALVSASEGSFDSNRHLEALIQGIEAKTKLLNLGVYSKTLNNSVNRVLEKAIYGADEYNSLTGHKGGVLAVKYSFDNQKIMSAGTDKTIKIWQSNGKLIKTLQGHKAAVRSISLSPNGKLIASASDDRTIKLWNSEGVLLKTFTEPTQGISSIDFNPKGDLIASSGVDGEVKIWSLDGKVITSIKTEIPFYRVVFSPDNKLLATGNGSGFIQLWTLEGNLVKAFKAHETNINDLDFSPDGKLIGSASSESKVKIWQLDGTMVATLAGNDYGVSDIDFSPDSQKIATASADQTIKLWKIDGNLISTFKGHNSFVTGVDFSNDGNFLVSGSQDQTVKIWKVENPFRTILNGHQGAVKSVAISKKHQIIATGDLDGFIKLWDFEGNLFKTITLPTTILDLSISSKVAIIAVALDNKTIQLFNFDGELLKTISAHKSIVSSVNFNHPGDLLASSSADASIKIWRSDGSLFKNLHRSDEIIWDVKFSLDDQIMAAGLADGTVQLWRSDGTFLSSFVAHDSGILKLIFSPDGKYIITSSLDNSVKLWLLDGTQVATIPSFQGPIWTVAISEDQQLLALAGVDKTIQLWKQDGNPRVFKLWKVLMGHTSTISEINFIQNADYLVSGSYDRSVIIWNIKEILNQDPLNYACVWVFDYLNSGSQSENHDHARDTDLKSFCDKIN